MRDAPNVLLVVLDTARADAFEPYGARSGSTPAVRQLAERGRAVPAAHAPACWTVPSHVGLFTGLLPRSAGVNHIGGGGPAHFRAALQHHADRLLPSVLRANGWETRGVSANHWIHPLSGFDTGFEEFRPVPSARARGLDPEHPRARIRWYLDGLVARLDDGARQIEELLDDWLRRRDRRPFLWFVNLVECHSPYLPPHPHTPLGPLERLRAAAEARRHLSFESIWMSSLGGFRVPESALARMRRLYDGAIEQLDAWLARVLDGLDAAGVLDDTQVVVTSDHGENLGEAGLLGHAFSLDERLLRVPLVTAGPLDLDPGDRPWSLVGLPHLLGTELGIAHPWEPPPWSGIAVAQFDAPGTAGHPALHEAIDRWGLGQDAADRMCASFTAATDGQRKLLRRGGRDLLVDLAADPLEQHPRPPTTAEADSTAVASLRAALDAAHADERPAIAQVAPAGVADAHVERQLRLLGYL